VAFGQHLVIKLNSNKPVNDVLRDTWGGEGCPGARDAEPSCSQSSCVSTFRGVVGSGSWRWQRSHLPPQVAGEQGCPSALEEAQDCQCQRTFKMIWSWPLILYLGKMKPRKVKRLVQRSRARTGSHAPDPHHRALFATP
jgi:hypothetical protein